ncbi:MAG: hypothetical protein HY815_02995 [Candidatus Riflebacteria bacterium]|nr:hypothetical protein [Candidatus Riflebacteria bacterium]
MIEGVCRVCGSPLSAPMVLCPTCETPHHRDCWDYNKGCSTYGCSAVAPRPVDLTPIVSAPQPGETESPIHEILSAVAGPVVVVTLALTAVVLITGSLLMLFLGVFVSIFAVRSYLRLQASGLIQPGLFQRLLEGRGARSDALARLEGPDREGDDGVALELKALAALIGTGATHALAQAYALFEQRHPRRTLPGDGQQNLAKELASGGVWALGLEALDKAIRMASGVDRDRLAAQLRVALLNDPAYAADALFEPGASRERRRTVLAAHRDCLQRLQEPFDREDPVYVLSLDARGRDRSADDPSETMDMDAAQPAPTASNQGSLAMGPIDPRPAKAVCQRLWEIGLPTALFPAPRLELPASPVLVREAHLTVKQARFVTARQEIVVPWDEVVAVIYARLDRVHGWDGLDPEHAVGRQSVLRSVDEREFEIIVEIHLRTAPVRLAISEMRPQLFEYLGRRRQLTTQANVVLLVKDLVRFAPGARVSHGVMGLLRERYGSGYRFVNSRDYEEYVRWFWMLGASPVRERWTVVAPALAADGPTP